VVRETPRSSMVVWESPTAFTRVAVEVDDEDVVVGVPVKRPETMPLCEIDRLLAWHLEDPLKRLRLWRRARNLARMPRFFRRAVWWCLLNVSGRKRARYFSTFCVTSLSKWGIDVVRPPTPLTSLLHYGAIDAHGQVLMRLTYDHRVIDGQIPSLAMQAMERHLRTGILAELQSLKSAPHAGSSHAA